MDRQPRLNEALPHQTKQAVSDRRQPVLFQPIKVVE